jgi:L-ribulose-5-phosphate 3-epimerase
MRMKKQLCGILQAALCFTAAAAIPAPAGDIRIQFGACDWTIERTGDPGALDLAKALGLEGVQVSIEVKGDTLPLLDPQFRIAYAEAVKRTGVQIASLAIGQLNDIPYKSDPRAETILEKGVDIARAMGVKIILVPFFGKGDLRNDPAGAAIVIERLKKLAPKAEKAGVILALESMLSAEDHVKILDAVGSPAVKIYYDVGNSQDAGYDIFREIRSLGGKICQFHAKDTRDLYGKGSMDFAAVRKAMEDIGYSGWFVLEGAKLPLGMKQSMRYDLEYLRTVFPEE